MATATKIKVEDGQSVQFPVLCKSWDEYYAIRDKYCKPESINHKGKPVYNHDVVRKFCIPPSEPR
jgi:hypothetical protein